MTNQIQDSVLDAIDTLFNHRIDKLEVDKTVTATIVECTNSITGEYLCSYNGGNLYAYASENSSYSTGSTVYVLVPLGDFSKRKTIVSKAQALEDDSNISFITSALSNYNLIGKNPVDENENSETSLPIGMSSYFKNNYILLYDRDDEENSILTFDNSEFSNGLKQAEAVLIEASFKTRLDKAHRLGQRGYYGLQFVLAFSDKDQVDENGNPAIKEYSYVLESNSMNGNPFLFTSWSEQYSILSVDVENFLYVKSIMVFCNDFVNEDDLRNAELWGEDVFVKDIEIYGLKSISAQNGDYIMTLSTPQGITFNSVAHNASLSVIGQMKKLQDNLSDQTMWYWFVEDTRIIPGADGYQMYGGSGWRYLEDKNNTYNFYTYGDENKGYENKYLCVAVYKETVILKEEFIIYNDSVKRDLSITSNMGVRFSFDRGTPTLTCLIDGKESGFEADQEDGRPDSWFNFIWSRVDKGTVISFEYTREELETQIADLQDQYDAAIASGLGYSELQAIRSSIISLENKINTQLVGATYEKGSNKFTYSVRQIESSAVFRCTVYTKDSSATDEFYNIGTAEIVLQNEDAAAPNSYYIIIENGEQVFQYSESGVSPADTRYDNPLEIKPLRCHFYDPAGIEVNDKTYQVKWQVPLESTMIVTPGIDSMTINPVSSKLEWCISDVYPLEIKSDYDYQALNNQVKCIVSYYGEEYSQYTNFLFTKVGENGTNGTDMVAKISPTSDSYILDGSCLTLEIGVNAKGEYSPIWNTGQTLEDKVLDFSLFQRNEEIALEDSVSWTVSGGSGNNSKYITGITDGIISWEQTEESKKRKYRNQIVKASIKIDVSDETSDRNNSEYYAFYPIPVIYYYANAEGQIKNYKVNIDPVRTLKSITYNADGRNPLYNKNQGISISFEGLEDPENNQKYIIWKAEGGQATSSNDDVYLDNPKNAAFTLTYLKNSKDGQKELTPRTFTVEEDLLNGVEGYSYTELLTEIHILPNDTYDGAFANNLVHGLIYTNEQAYLNGAKPEVELYIPIYMSLNRFGLQSLNAWDGNHLEINEDENYILAPQIGAGAKDENNAFTGVVMGTAKTYDQEESNIGLLGYSHGKQSIWLDSETGNAIFGLPEQQASANNQYTEGRIELIPGGDSKIGMWTIGSRAMYNITDPETGGKLADDTGAGILNGVGSPYTGEYEIEGAQISVPHKAQGIILNANPPYLSIKGRPLTEDNSNISFGDANTALFEHDSLEIELNPMTDSIFSIFRHTDYEQKEDGSWERTGNYRRYPLVGINQNGQFYTNAIEDGESAMGIGFVGAFGFSAADQKYIGAQFSYRNKNLFKFFIDADDSSETTLETRKLYISTGSDANIYNEDGTIADPANEYPREVGIYGSSVALYAPGDNTASSSSRHNILINDKFAFLGHNEEYNDEGEVIEEGSYLKIIESESRDDNGIRSRSELKLNSSLDITTLKERELKITSDTFQILSHKESGDENIKSFDVKLDENGIDYSFSSGNFNIETSTGNFLFKADSLSIEVNSTNLSQEFISLKGVNNSEEEEEKKERFNLTLSNQSSVKSSLFAYSGWDIRSVEGGISIKSEKNSEGVIISAELPGVEKENSESDSNSESDNNSVPDANTNLVVLRMLPSSDGNDGYFELSSQNGTVKATPRLFRQKNGDPLEGIEIPTNDSLKEDGVSITDGIRTGTLYVESAFQRKHEGTAGTSIIASGNIKTNHGWLYGTDFAFNTTQSFDYYYGTATGTQLSFFLSNIYELLNDLRRRMLTAEGNITTAQSRADSAYSYAENIKTKYNKHWHRFSYNTTEIDNWNVVTSISSEDGQIKAITQVPPPDHQA